MNKKYKLLLIILFILLILSLLIFIPLPIYNFYDLDPDVIFEYTKTDLEGGSLDLIRIYQNSSVETSAIIATYDGNGQIINKEKYKTSISNEQLQTLNKMINEKDYSLKKKSIFSMWLDSYQIDGGSIQIYINKNGRTIFIEENKISTEIVLPILEDMERIRNEQYKK